MSSIVQLKSGSTSVILGPIEDEYISARLDSGGVSGGITSYLYTDYEDYYGYFRDIADNWKGWEGSKDWQTVEGDLRFEATHDSHGHVLMKITLIKNQGVEDEWCLSAQVKLELGQLEGLANDIKKTLPQK